MNAAIATKRWFVHLNPIAVWWDVGGKDPPYPLEGKVILVISCRSEPTPVSLRLSRFDIAAALT